MPILHLLVLAPGRRKSGGFTLIELLVVVLIIGVLAAVALPQYQKAVLKSRYAQMRVTGRALQTSIDAYYAANGTYPASWEEVDIKLPGALGPSGVTWVSGGYSCTLYMGVSDAMDSFICFWGKNAGANDYLRYRIILSKPYLGKQYCVGTTEKQEEFCKSMGGKNPFDNGAGAMHYEL